MSDLPTRSRLLALSQWYEGPGMGMDKRVASVLGAYTDGDLMTRAEWEATAIMVICKHNTPDALTTSLFLSPMDGNEIPEGEYALVRVCDREDS